MYPPPVYKTNRDRSRSPLRSEQTLDCHERTWLWVDDLVRNTIDQTSLFDLEDQFPEVKVTIRLVENDKKPWRIIFEGPPLKKKQLRVKIFEELLARNIECLEYGN